MLSASKEVMLVEKTTVVTVLKFKFKTKFFEAAFVRKWKTSKPKRETEPRKK